MVTATTRLCPCQPSRISSGSSTASWSARDSPPASSILQIRAVTLPVMVVASHTGTYLAFPARGGLVMARAIWKGSISFGLVNIPVGLYTAEKANELSFDLLDSRDKA